MPSLGLPPHAAWLHRHVREGFEVVFVWSEDGRHRFQGSTSAVEDGEPWIVQYWITVASDWSTRSARVRARSASGAHEVEVEADGAGRWWVDGRAVRELDGCMDVDLESSALTNALPVRRLGLAVGGSADAPAAYVRALGLRVERLEQRYLRLGRVGTSERYRYAAPDFGVECDLSYDESGLVADYPGLAVRVG